MGGDRQLLGACRGQHESGLAVRIRDGRRRGEVDLLAVSGDLHGLTRDGSSVLVQERDGDDGRGRVDRQDSGDDFDGRARRVDDGRRHDRKVNPGQECVLATLTGRLVGAGSRREVVREHTPGKVDMVLSVEAHGVGGVIVVAAQVGSVGQTAVKRELGQEGVNVGRTTGAGRGAGGRRGKVCRKGLAGDERLSRPRHSHRPDDIEIRAAEGRGEDPARSDRIELGQEPVPVALGFGTIADGEVGRGGGAGDKGGAIAVDG